MSPIFPVPQLPTIGVRQWPQYSLPVRMYSTLSRRRRDLISVRMVSTLSLALSNVSRLTIAGMPPSTRTSP